MLWFLKMENLFFFLLMKELASFFSPFFSGFFLFFLFVLNSANLSFFLFIFFSGFGFMSQDFYLHGFFGASIKLPADYTAGVVVAFYVVVAMEASSNEEEGL